MIENLLDKEGRFLMEHERKREADERLLREEFGMQCQDLWIDTSDMDEEGEEDGEETASHLTDSAYSDQDKECLVPLFGGVWRQCYCVHCREDGSDEDDRDSHSDVSGG